MPGDEFWVIAEQAGSSVTQLSLEAIGLAKQLQSGPVSAVVFGAATENAARALAQHGAAKVFALESPELKDPLGELTNHAILALIRERKPTHIFLPASSMGRDLAPRLAAGLGVAFAPDCVAVASRAGKLEYTRPVFAGKVLAAWVLTGTPQIATLRPRIAPAAAVENAAAPVEKITPQFPSDLKRPKILEVKLKDSGKPELTEADVVVSGGRGLGQPENYRWVEELAKALGAATGASRAIVDLGWRPHEDQVGQTGKTVSPKLYVACGISGAIQHRVGMQTSQC
ncbi:electron transfer flavoprotein subunit alpha/FixB family protein, partial [Candidatus Uhrbacteria bacterium]|nr:electron transfer flavoprotein subunit alpha/FixB family protein [Candidatus Uhrbacteria bacterium]